jgi:hypothetical protein
MACAALSELGAALSWSPYSEDAQSEAIGLSDEFSVHLQRSFEQKMGGTTADASKLRRQADSFAKGCVAFLSESDAWTRWRSPCSSDFAQLLNDQEAALRADRARLELQRAAEVGSGPAATVTAANRTVPSQCAPRCAHITLTVALALHGMARMLHSVRFALLQVACASQPPPVRGRWIAEADEYFLGGGPSEQHGNGFMCEPLAAERALPSAHPRQAATRL